MRDRDRERRKDGEASRRRAAAEGSDQRDLREKSLLYGEPQMTEFCWVFSLRACVCLLGTVLVCESPREFSKSTYSVFSVCASLLSAVR